jgi:hypothetical protein
VDLDCRPHFGVACIYGLVPGLKSAIWLSSMGALISSIKKKYPLFYRIEGEQLSSNKVFIFNGIKYVFSICLMGDPVVEVSVKLGEVQSVHFYLVAVNNKKAARLIDLAADAL